MIQWIALALAIDAEGKSAQANRRARSANRRSKRGANVGFVILRPADLQEKFEPWDKTKGFWWNLSNNKKKYVLDDKPFATYAVHESDILSLKEKTDSNRTKYVEVSISTDAKLDAGNGNYWISLNIPGSIETVAGVINSARSQ